MPEVIGVKRKSVGVTLQCLFLVTEIRWKLSKCYLYSQCKYSHFITGYASQPLALRRLRWRVGLSLRLAWAM